MYLIPGLLLPIYPPCSLDRVQTLHCLFFFVFVLFCFVFIKRSLKSCSDLLPQHLTSSLLLSFHTHLVSFIFSYIHSFSMNAFLNSKPCISIYVINSIHPSCHFFTCVLIPEYFVFPNFWMKIFSFSILM